MTADFTMRPATLDEAPTVRRLAQLADRPTLRGAVTVAVADGEIVAAVSHLDGRVVADPFGAAMEHVVLLREHVNGPLAMSRPRLERAERGAVG